ncbi:LEA type 2 family protein [Flavobacteriaceae bacterium]|nr:LEA type 2 family protein [Flavobacteriaceae bacterium]
MRLFKRYLFIVLFTNLFFLVGCSSIKTPEIISINNAEITKEDSESFFIDSQIKIYNPNRFSISTKDISFNLYIDSLYIGKGDVNKGLTLEKNNNSNITTSLVINKSKLKSFSNLKDSISLSILGSTNIPYIPKKFYFDFDYKIYPNDLIAFFTDRLIEDIKIQIKEVKIKKLNIKNIFLEMTFVLDNKSSMECKVKALDVKLFKTNAYKNLIGSSEIKNDFIVRSNTTNQFESQLMVNTLKMGTAFFTNTINNKNSFFVEVNSIIEYNNLELPITIKKRIDYNPRTLEIELK